MSLRTLPSAVLSLFGPALQADPELGEAAGRALGLARLDPESPARIEAGRLVDLMRLVQECDGSRETALQLAFQLPLGALGPLGAYLNSAADLREWLTDVHRYWPTREFTDCAFEVSIGSDLLSIGFRPSPNPPAGEMLCLESSLMLLLRLLRELLRAPLRGAEISYPARETQPAQDWTRLLGLPVRRGGELLRLLLPVSLLDAPVRAASAELRAAVQPSLDAELRRIREQSSWTRQVHELLEADASLIGWDLPRCAQRLGVHAASLREHLLSEQSSFELILDGLRRERALHLLLAAEVPAEELAATLGFPDRSAFEVQFRHWFQTTPTALRSDAAAAGIDARRGNATVFDELPPAPQTCRTLIELRYMEDASIEDIARAIETDPALSAKVLGLASSAFYGARKVRDLKHAISQLGLNELTRIATVLSARQSLQPKDCPAFDLLSFWTRSLAVGHAAAELVRGTGESTDVEGVRLLGLFHDLGLQVWAHRAGSKLQAHLQALPADASERAIRYAELRDLGTTRHITGSILLARWGLPPDTVRALRSMDHAILDPHADIAFELRIIVALSRYFRRRFDSLPVDDDLAAISQLFTARGLSPRWDADELGAGLDEILETRRLQAEELLS